MVPVTPAEPITTSLNVAPLPDQVWLAIAPVPTISISAPVAVKVPPFDKLPRKLNKVPALIVRVEPLSIRKLLQVMPDCVGLPLITTASLLELKVELHALVPLV